MSPITHVPYILHTYLTCGCLLHIAKLIVTFEGLAEEPSGGSNIEACQDAAITGGQAE